MRYATTTFLAASLAGSLVSGAGWVATAAAEPAAAAPTAADFNRISAELARVQQQLREQRALILQVMEMHSVLLRYMQSAPPGALPALPPSTGGQSTPAPVGAAPPAAAPIAEPPTAAQAGAKAAAAPPREATVTGTVRTKDASVGELYVYVDGLRGGPAHPPNVEIKQKDRRFSPAVAVVPVNTRVLFPNVDKVFHNVFSVTPGAAFDLGTVKAGEKSSPTLLAKPGHVEVFCNIHSKMRADILVVPNTHWARVRADGTFQLPGVPVGTYRLVLWGPTVKPAAQRIDIAGTGPVTASFTAEPAPPARHMNKHGAEYGSYDD